MRTASVSFLGALFAASVLWLGAPPPSQAQTGAQIPQLNEKVDQLIGAGDYAKVTPLAEQILRAAETTLGKDHPDTVASVNNLAELYSRQNRSAEAERLYERALESNERARGKDHAATLTSANRLALLYYGRGRYGEAEALFKRVLDARERLLGKNHRDTLISVNNLAGMYQGLGRYREAEALYKRALEGFERVMGKEHSETLSIANNIGVLYTNQGRFAEAEPLVKRVLAAQERSHGKDHADTVRSVNNLATIYHQQGRYGEAEPLYKRAIAGRERALGKEHPETLGSISNLGELYRQLGRYGEAEPLHARVLEARERLLGKKHPDTLNTVNNLAMLYDDQGRFDQAVALQKRVVETQEAVLGKEHPETLASINNLANVYSSQGRYGEAEPLFRRALEASERVLGPEHPTTLVSLNNLAGVYDSQADYGKAEPLYRRALEIRERVAGKEHPDTLASLINLAKLYDHQGRTPESEALLKRALETGDKVLGKDHPTTLVAVNNLAILYNGRGDAARAEPLLKRAVASLEQVMGKEHPRTLQGLNNLAMFYFRQGRVGEAEPLLKRTFAAQQRVLGGDHPHTFTTQFNLAELYYLGGRDSEAEPLFRQLLAAQERVLGKEHPDTLRTLGYIAIVHIARSEWAPAEQLLRRSAEALSRRALRRARDASQSLTSAETGNAAAEKGLLIALVKTMRHKAGGGRPMDAAAARETFRIAQGVLDSEAGRSLAQMAARGAARDAKLAALVRERQDLVAEWHKRDGARNAALALPSQQRSAQAEAENAARLAAIDAGVAGIDKTLQTAFPDYAALANPEPLSVEQVQAQLRPHEAVVLIMPTIALRPTLEETFVWVVTKTEMRWVASSLGLDALLREVHALRCGLDYTFWQGKRCAELTDAKYSLAEYARGKQLPFDVARSHRLYKALFGEVEDLVKDKHLLIVPSGPLTQLPFQVLVSAPSTDGGYKSARWLARTNAITVLPAVPSLTALRQLSRPSAAAKPLIGFGNPLLDGDGDSSIASAKAARGKQSCPPTPVQNVAMRQEMRAEMRGAAASIGARRGLVDVADIRKLSPLPETADEVCAVAQGIGADAGEARLGARATEREVKQLSASGALARYRTLHFATHGATAGQFRDGAEPGLILTPPAQASEADDGYLSASEIAGLKLDADWVILSACNTAAGNAAEAEMLSGLARAFIYAQARALLVSHWEVDSLATVKLITAAMREVAKGKAVGRAEALRRAMLALIDSGTPQEAHPAVWAPFIVVGEGAPAR